MAPTEYQPTFTDHPQAFGLLQCWPGCSELITLTMELVGDNTRFDKFTAIFLTMDSCFFTLWDVQIRFKDRNLAFGRIGYCYFWLIHENLQPSWAPDIVCDFCSSVFVIYHLGVAVLDSVYRGHGSTYVFTLVAFVLATLVLIPTQLIHGFQQVSCLLSKQRLLSNHMRRPKLLDSLETMQLRSKIRSFPLYHLQLKVWTSLRARFIAFNLAWGCLGVFCTMLSWRQEVNHIRNRTKLAVEGVAG